MSFNNGRLVNLNGENSFAYDANGLRIRKNDIKYEYLGGKLIREMRGNVPLTYMYGTSGMVGFKYSEREYYYQKNLLGDIIGLVTYNGAGKYEYIAFYEYDAFGNHKVYDADWNENTNPNFIGNINPIRYRGYYYDTETKLYFINNRYYDSDLCRYVSPDPKNGEIFKPNLDTRFKI
jgi:RHS repeat-associated protein